MKIPKLMIDTLQSCEEIMDDGLYCLGKALKALPYLEKVHLNFIL